MMRPSFDFSSGLTSGVTARSPRKSFQVQAAPPFLLDGGGGSGRRNDPWATPPVAAAGNGDGAGLPAAPPATPMGDANISGSGLRTPWSVMSNLLAPARPSDVTEEDCPATVAASSRGHPRIIGGGRGFSGGVSAPLPAPGTALTGPPAAGYADVAGRRAAPRQNLSRLALVGDVGGGAQAHASEAEVEGTACSPSSATWHVNRTPGSTGGEGGKAGLGLGPGLAAAMQSSDSFSRLQEGLILTAGASNGSARGTATCSAAAAAVRGGGGIGLAGADRDCRPGSGHSQRQLHMQQQRPGPGPVAEGTAEGEGDAEPAGRVDRAALVVAEWIASSEATAAPPVTSRPNSFMLAPEAPTPELAAAEGGGAGGGGGPSRLAGLGLPGGLDAGSRRRMLALRQTNESLNALNHYQQPEAAESDAGALVSGPLPTTTAGEGGKHGPRAARSASPSS